jgi:CHAT domain-containing protein/tetratricopeptide (TPR) repeat protein
MFKIINIVGFAVLISSFCNAQNLDSLYKEIEKNVNNKDYSNALINSNKYKIFIESTHGNSENDYLKIDDAFAEIYKQLHIIDSAEMYYKNVIKRSLKNNGDSSYVYANSNFKLGMFYNKIDSFKKAEYYLIQPGNIFKNVFGEKSSKYDTYLNLVLEYYIKSKEFEKAIPYFNELLQHMRLRTGEDNIDYINSLNNLATLYFAIGKYNMSIEICKKILLFNKTKVIPKLYENTIYKIASNEFEKKDYKNSKNNFLTLLNFYKEKYLTNDDIYYNANGYLGLISLLESDYKEAIKKSTDVYNYFLKKGNNNLNLLQSISNLAYIYTKIGDNERAVLYFKESVKLIEKDKIQNRSSAMLYSNYSMFYENNLNNYDSAIKFGEEAFKIRGNIFNQNHPDLILSMNNQGMLYLKNKEFEKAKILLIKAFELEKENPNIDSILFSAISSNLSLYYISVGDYNNSLYYGLKSLAYKLNKDVYDKVSITTSLNNVALSYFYNLDYENAEIYFLKSMSYIELKSKNERITYATLSSNLGILYERTKEIEKAFLYTKKALDIRKEFSEENIIDYSLSLNNLGLLYIDIGELDSAEKYLIKSLKLYIKKEIIYRDEIETIYSNLAGLFFKKRDYEKTLYYLHQGNKLRNEDKNNTFLYLSENEKLKLNQSKQYFFDAYLSFFNQIYRYIPNETEEIYNNILSNKEQLLRKYQNFYEKIYNTRDTDLISDFESILNKKDFLYKEIAKNISINKIDEIKNSIDKLENKLNKNKIIKDILSGEKSINWKDIQKKLKFNEAAIEFVSYHYFNSKWTDSILYGALLIKPGLKTPLYISLFEENDLINILKSNNTLNITHQNNIYNFKDKGANLYKMIWEPIDSSLKGVTTVFISLSNKLLNLNLLAIPIDDSLKLGQKYKIHQVISTADIVNFNEEYFSNKIINNAWIFGGINYDSSNNKISQAKDYYSKNKTNRSSEGILWSYLNSTQKEANTIEAILNKYNVNNFVITGSNANENSFKAISNDSSNYILHIATHGYFFPDSYYKGDEIKIVKSNTSFLGVETEKVALGLRIINIAANSPAENNRLKLNDIIYQVDGVDLNEPIDLFNILKKKKPNETINIKYLMGGSKFQTNITLILNPNKDSSIYKFYDPSAFIKKSENPLFRSGLIFAGANNINNNVTQDDGILTAYEVSNLNLSGAKLVVLSACETGLGDIVASEGIYGLQRAFKIAGVKNIIMSLWKVPDNQTEELMGLFYDNIFNGQTISTALQKAQLEMSKKYPPYYWAAFKLLE